MGKVRYFLLFCSFLLVSFLYAQPVKFQRTYGGTAANEYIDGTCPTADGGYILCFNQSSPTIPSTCVLMKTDSAGNSQWAKTYTRTGYTSSGGPVIQTLDKGYLFRIQLYNGSGSHACLVKTDSNGDTSWVQCNVGTRFLQLPDSSFVCGGMRIVKLDKKGKPQWQKGFPGGDGGGDLNVTKDKGFISFGLTYKYSTGGPNNNADFYLVKSDSLGNMQWNKRYGLTGGTWGETTAWGTALGRSVIETQDGGYIMAGSTDACGVGTWDIVVIKTNSAGNLQWSYTYGGIHLDYPTCIRQDKVGYILMGTTHGGAESTTPQNSERTFLTRLDLNGGIVWSMMYGSVVANPWNAADLGYSPGILPGNGYIFGGHTSSMGSGNADIWLVKTDGNGVSGCNEKPLLFSTKIPPFIITSAGGDTILPLYPYGDSTLQIGAWQYPDSVLCPATPVTVNEWNEAESAGIYPNPSSGIFAIDSKGYPIKTVQVFNAVGEQVRSLSNTSIVDISSEPEGIYFVRMQTGEGIINKKLVLIK